MQDDTSHRCEECNDALYEHNGQYLCPTCDNIEGFTLDVDEESFEL